MVARRRLGTELLVRRLVADGDDVTAMIEAHCVLVNGAVAETLDRLVAPSDSITIVEPPRFVGRGGEKLSSALDDLGIDVTGTRWLDAGASTGGFTDCLLQRGAAHVVAADVGHGHLYPRLRSDPRVTVLERTHVRDLTPAMLGGAVDGAAADLSFISLKSVLGTLIGVCQPGASMVLLVKPQFEASRAEVSAARGVIVDAAVHDRVREEIARALSELGATVVGWAASPITGAHGNREFFVHALTPGPTAGSRSP